MLKSMSRVLVAAAALGVALLGCGSPSATVPPELRRAAIQQALDRSDGLSVAVIAGLFCPASPNDPIAAREIAAYYRVPEARVTRTVQSFGPENYRRTFHCWVVAWQRDSGVIARPGRVFSLAHSGAARIGRFELVQVGDEQVRGGSALTPFTARFVPSQLGMNLIAATVIARPRDIGNAFAAFHKDANGNLIATVF